jgi:hypothetical protein
MISARCLSTMAVIAASGGSAAVKRWLQHDDRNESLDKTPNRDADATFRPHTPAAERPSSGPHV